MDNRVKTLEIINNQLGTVPKTKLSLSSFVNKITNNGKKKICLFGAGEVGQHLSINFKKNGIQVDCFCDNDKSKANKVIINEIKCISLEKLITMKDDFIIIISVLITNEIRKQLISLGFVNVINYYSFKYFSGWQDINNINTSTVSLGLEKLFDILSDEKSKDIVYHKIKNITEFYLSKDVNMDLGNIYSSNQYFPSDIGLINALDKLNKGAFIDCGAYTGDTLKYVIDKGLIGIYSKYICYELDKGNYEHLEKFVSSLPQKIRNKITTYNLGVSNENRDIIYSSLEGGSKIDTKNGGEKGQVIALSNDLANEKVSFIKMDIEGSEIAALNGAWRIIEEQEPVLAISIYHKFEDLWEIPLLIKRINPNYKIFLRHHSYSCLETVCYAIPK